MLHGRPTAPQEPRRNIAFVFAASKISVNGSSTCERKEEGGGHRIALDDLPKAILATMVKRMPECIAVLMGSVTMMVERKERDDELG